MTHLTPSVALFCVLSIAAMPTAGEVCAAWEAVPSWGPLPRGEVPPSSGLAKWRVLLSKGQGRDASIRTTGVESYAHFQIAIRHMLETHPCSVAISNRPWLLNLALTSSAPVKALPFDPKSISARYKLFAGDGRLLGMSIGWIPKTLDDRYVLQDGATVVLQFPIRDLADNKVYPWTEFSVLGLDARGQGRQPDVKALVEALASPEASMLMGDFFWVVPNNSKLGRRLRIEIVDDNKKLLAATLCSSSSCYPEPADAVSVTLQAGGISYAVCSSNTSTKSPDVSSACPQFHSSLPIAAQGARMTKLPSR